MFTHQYRWICKLSHSPWCKNSGTSFIGGRKSGLLFCTRNGKQLSQSNILRRHLHPALAEVGFEKAGNHAFRRFRDTFLKSHTQCPEDVLHFWLGWGEEGMSGHYNGMKEDVAFRKDVVKRCGVGFDVPVSLASIEPNEPKIEAPEKEEVAVNAFSGVAYGTRSLISPRLVVLSLSVAQQFGT